MSCFNENDRGNRPRKAKANDKPMDRRPSADTRIQGIHVTAGNDEGGGTKSYATRIKNIPPPRAMRTNKPNASSSCYAIITEPGHKKSDENQGILSLLVGK